jgi:hypothetical protein
MSSAQRSSEQSATKHSIGETPRNLAHDAGPPRNEVPRFVTQARVSHLLAIPEEEVRQISRDAGLGRVERAGKEVVTYFTYDEMCQLGLLAAQIKRAGEH